MMDGDIDEVAIYDRVLTTGEITELYNSGTGYNPYDAVASVDYEYNLTINQTPSDIIFPETFTLNLTLDVDTDNEYNNLNDSYATLNYIMNTSLNGGCAKFENTICTMTDYASVNMTKTNNTYFTSLIDDTNLYPAYYPFYAQWMEEAPKSYETIYKSNNVKWEVFNFSTSESLEEFMIMELMAENLTYSYPLNIYYCNETYTTGKPRNNGNCELLQSYNYDDYTENDHSHGINSYYRSIPFNQDQVTPSAHAYFLFTSNAPNTAKGWSIAYATNTSYTNQYFSNSDFRHNTYTTATANKIYDFHFHQFLITDSFDYYITYNSTDENAEIKTSTLEQDDFDVLNIAPYGVTIYNPCNITYVLGSDSNTSMLFNWSETTDFNNDSFTQNVTIKNGLTSYNLFTVNNGISDYNYTTDKEAFLTGIYQTQIYLEDANTNGATSTSTCEFNICINDWVQQLSTCSNATQTITYTDSNACSLQYDVPVLNGTQQVCAENNSVTNPELLLMIGFLLILFLIFLIVKSYVFGLLTFAYHLFLTFHLNEVYEGSSSQEMILIGMLFVGLVILLLSTFNYLSRKNN